MFVHYDATAHDGTFEVVVAVKLDDDGKAVVDGFLANWLPAASLPDEAAARAAASEWTADLADADRRKQLASRTAFPFWSLGLPHGSGKTCKDEQRAADAHAFAAIAGCAGQADTAELFARLPHGKWEVVGDVDAIATDAEGDDNHIAQAQAMLDRLMFDHLVLVDRWHDDDAHVEVVVAVRADSGRAVIDAVVANVY